ncbi:hypothetical protein H6G27_28865 [Nostoc linckia FACHB-104]|nr:hypothetical protein [Nostoc linckia FACHB-104]
MSKVSKTKNIITGCFLLLLFHLVFTILIIVIAALTQSNYNLSLKIIVYGIYGFSLWQLIYAIPLCLWLKYQGKNYVMKGVFIAVLVTLLVHIGYFLLVFGLIIR